MEPTKTIHTLDFLLTGRRMHGGRLAGPVGRPKRSKAQRKEVKRRRKQRRG